jgi:uncharacterized protein (DUF2236 family)
MCWQIHQDFTAMMVGGVSALMLQTLHPRALAGVWDHSNFRDDLKGRLGRTAFFISCTTYGGTELAERAIAHVRNIHQHVRGTAPDGTPYSAEDPELLTWVHVTEVLSFLKAYRKYVDPRLSESAQDAYLDEMAIVATKLGAVDVPRRCRTMDQYLEAQRPHLHASQRTREVIKVLHGFEPRRASQLFIRGGYQLLPPWAAEMLGAVQAATIDQSLTHGTLHMMGPLMRWALAKEGVAQVAKRRALSSPI